MSDLETMAEALRASGEYRVQRRLVQRDAIAAADGTPVKVGLFVDVETTGLDPERSEIIELAMIPFTYANDGRIFEIRAGFEGFQEPSEPIPAEITRLTGITDDMVAGKKIDVDAVRKLANEAAVVIAHNASFDRRFLERLSDVFVLKPWACSMNQVDWTSEGHEGTKLAYLAAGAGFFYDRHRAANDCRAAIELLASPLPASGQLGMQRLLETARRSSWRIWAENSPFDLKDVLKARGYRWNGDGNASPKSWYIDVEERLREEEMTFLRKEIYLYDVDLLMREITPYNRFSSRI